MTGKQHTEMTKTVISGFYLLNFLCYFVDLFRHLCDKYKCFKPNVFTLTFVKFWGKFGWFISGLKMEPSNSHFCYLIFTVRDFWLIKLAINVLEVR